MHRVRRSAWNVIVYKGTSDMAMAWIARVARVGTIIITFGGKLVGRVDTNFYPVARGLESLAAPIVIYMFIRC